eukprot:CAMPEP_0113942792 /NCGR_PEP_ID=MMETSP1339-20121228/9651_1 /TAXON_ID=94617 /ORGANISM="Fibrocapsa japonica" /LENGTH=253 /DNA_ID=CAMNT_0000947415 /DNA_START=83 /DNA_END=841 /DNA_ORIENTATION=+ /assembly_acc=CAM_ASM_000762
MIVGRKAFSTFCLLACIVAATALTCPKISALPLQHGGTFSRLPPRADNIFTSSYNSNPAEILEFETKPKKNNQNILDEESKTSSPELLNTPLLKTRSPTNSMRKGVSLWAKVVQISFSPAGAGQDWNVPEGARRSWSDHMMWTHLFFVVAAAFSFGYRLWELFALEMIVLVLSVLYHRGYESPGPIAAVEGFFAKSLFLYAVIQLWNAPSQACLLAESSLCLATFSFFAITNIKKDLYEKFHSIGLHVIPSIW